MRGARDCERTRRCERSEDPKKDLPRVVCALVTRGGTGCVGGGGGAGGGGRGVCGYGLLLDGAVGGEPDVDALEAARLAGGGTGVVADTGGAGAKRGDLGIVAEAGGVLGGVSRRRGGRDTGAVGVVEVVALGSAGRKGRKGDEGRRGEAGACHCDGCVVWW